MPIFSPNIRNRQILTGYLVINQWVAYKYQSWGYFKHFLPIYAYFCIFGVADPTTSDINIGPDNIFCPWLSERRSIFLSHYPCSRANISGTKRARDLRMVPLEASGSWLERKFRFSEVLEQVFHEIFAFKDSRSYSANLRNESGKIQFIMWAYTNSCSFVKFPSISDFLYSKQMFLTWELNKHVFHWIQVIAKHIFGI